MKSIWVVFGLLALLMTTTVSSAVAQGQFTGILQCWNPSTGRYETVYGTSCPSQSGGVSGGAGGSARPSSDYETERLRQVEEQRKLEQERQRLETERRQLEEERQRQAQQQIQSSPQVQVNPQPSVPPMSKPSTGRRIALVIGNGAYKEGPLKNPPNDARDMAQVLRSMGFEVIARENAGLAQMEAALDEFWGKLKKGGVGLFYYAGHGLQVNGRNYLVPVDAKILAEQDIKYKCLDAGLVLGRMENAGNDLNIIILDACRTNPFARSWRSADLGLAKMDAPKGALIAYATAPDSVAADGEGKNGLYTEKLLKAMRMPKQPVELMFKHVRDEVMRSTKDKQVPWESTSLRGNFYFVP